MTTLPDPRVQAIAKARAIEVRAHAISHFGNQLATISEPLQLKPEEWAEYSDTLTGLLDELKEEIRGFVQKANYAI